MYNKKILWLIAAVIVILIPLSALAGQGANFDLGFPQGFSSYVDGDAVENAKAVQDTLPKEMNVYTPSEPGGKIQIFVSNSGNDKNSGTIDAPVKTLKQALSVLKTYSDRSCGAVIWLREGLYTIDQTVEIPATLSGTKDAPLYISAYNNEKVSFMAAKTVDKASYSVSQDAEKDRIKENSLDKIRVIDLSGTDMDYEITRTGPSAISVDGLDYTPARYPNNGYLKFATYTGADAVAGVIDPGDVWQLSVAETGSVPFTGNTTRGFEFKMDTFRPTKWENDGNIWIYGRMSVDWDWNYYTVDTINSSIPSLRSKQPSNWACFKTNYNQYYFLNVLEEIDVPGESYFDVSTKKLYFYPYKQYTDSEKINVKIPQPGITYMLKLCGGLKNVILNGITFSDNSASGVYVEGENCVVQNCEFKNLSANGLVLYGMYNGVSHSLFTKCGNGVTVNASNEGIIEPKFNDDSYMFVQNNYFEHINQRSIRLSGTSTRAVISHNTSNAIRDQFIYGDNLLECVVEYNRSVGGAIDVGDSGDIYCPYGMFAFKQNTFRYNYFDGDLPCGNAGRSSVYFDTFAQGNYVYGNYVVDKNVKVGDKQAVYDNIYIAKDAYAGKSHIGYSDSFFALDGFAGASLTNIYQLTDTQYGNYRNLSLNSKNRYAFDYGEYYDSMELFKRAGAYGYYDDEIRSKDAEFRKFDDIIYKDNLFFNYADGSDKVYHQYQNQNNLITKDSSVFKDYENGDYNLNEKSGVYDKVPSLRDVPSTDTMGSELKIDLETPQAFFPFNNTDDFVAKKDLIFRWNDCRGATYYKIEIAKDKNFENLVVGQYIKGVYNYYSDNMADTGASVSGHDIKVVKANLETDLENDTVYYWRVKAFAKIPNADFAETCSDISQFRVGTKKEIAESEEAETSNLLYAIAPYKEYLEKYLVEDDGTDHGYGVYKPGTRELLEKRITDEEAAADKLRYNSEVAEHIATFEKDAQKILSDNAIEYTRKFTDYLEDFMVVGNSNVVQISADGKEVTMGGDVQSVIASKRPLSPKEKISFKYRPDENTSWNTIGIRQTSNSATNVLSCTTYFICFSGKNIELQKVYNGKVTDDRIICTVEDQGYVKYGDWNDIETGAVTTDEGVRVTFTINGKEIMNYLDTNNPVTEIGYASVMWNKGGPKCRLQTME